MISINAEKREEKGSKLKDLRKNKIVPAIIYGKEVGNIPIKLEEKKFKEIYKEAGESTIIKLKIDKDDKEKEYPVLIREVQKHPLTDEILHVDFYQVPMDKEIEVMAPLEFKGISPAEKELGAIIVKNIHEVEIKALPQNLIHSIEVDISSLKNIDDEVKIKDLKIPEGVKIIADPEEIVAIAVPPKEEKIEEAEATAPEEVEVIKEKKEESLEENEEKKKNSE